MTNQELVTDLLTRLANAGWILRVIDDGGDEDLHPKTIEEAVSDIFAVTEATAFFREEGGGHLGIFFTPYNEGVEVVCDHSTGNPEFEAIIDRWTWDHAEDE